MIAIVWMILYLVHPSRLLALKKPPAEHFYHHRSSFCRLKNKQRLFGITSNTSSWFIRRPGVHCCLQRGRVCAREVDRRAPSLWEAVTDLSVMFRRNMMMLVPLLTSLIMTKLFTWKTSLPIDVIMLKCLGPGVLVTTWAQSGENVRPDHRLIPPDPNMLNLLGCFSPHPSQSLQPPKTAKILLVIGPWIFGIKNSIWTLTIGILHLLTCWLPDPPGAGSQRPTDPQCKNRLLRLARVFPALQVIKLVPLVVVDGDVIIIIIIHVDDKHVHDDGDVLPGPLLDQTGPLAHTRCTEISYFRFRLEWDDFLFSIDMARSLLIWQKKRISDFKLFSKGKFLRSYRRTVKGKLPQLYFSISLIRTERDMRRA